MPSATSQVLPSRAAIRGRNCVRSGIRRIAALTQYSSQTLIRHVAQAWDFLLRALSEFVEVWPAQQRNQAEQYSGTANAVYQNVDMIRAQAPRFVPVLGRAITYRE